MTRAPLLQDGVQRNGDADAGAGRDQLEQRAAGEQACVSSDPRETVRIIHNRPVQRGPREARRCCDDEQHARAEGCFTVRVHAPLLSRRHGQSSHRHVAGHLAERQRPETVSRVGIG